MDIKKVKELVSILEKSKLTELELEDKTSSIRLVKHQGQVAPVMQQVAPAPAPVAAPAPAPAASEAPAKAEDSGASIDSPMVGTFYASPSPDAKPFVSVGDTVKTGDVVCIIEAMKTMNKITCDTPGKIKSILVENGNAVEFKQKLFVLE